MNLIMIELVSCHFLGILDKIIATASSLWQRNQLANRKSLATFSFALSPTQTLDIM